MYASQLQGIRHESLRRFKSSQRALVLNDERDSRDASSDSDRSTSRLEHPGHTSLKSEYRGLLDLDRFPMAMR